jgi:HEAT repeat protein
MIRQLRWTAALAVTLLVPVPSHGQDAVIERRVAAVAEGQVQFQFASHAGVCGDGERWFRVGDDSWYGSFSSGDSRASSGCVRGPVRVTVTKMAREVIRIETEVGPLKVGDGVTDLGAVPARAAAAWLFDLASRSEGRPARDAILPAVLADSGNPTAALVRIAQDRERSREVRRSAISWLARAPGLSVAEGTRSLRAIAADERDSQSIRQSALSALLRLPRGEGIAPLIALAGTRDDLWLGREAVKVIARSGDPRARAYLRTAVADARLADELRTAAITGLGGDMATGADAALLRSSWRTITAQSSREALLTAVGSIGGSVNAEWLISIARDQNEAVGLRQRAVTRAERAGATGAQLAAVYDAANLTELRNTTISALASEGSKASRDKLIEIAGSTESTSVRRRAISALERIGGEDARDALTSLAIPDR